MPVLLIWAAFLLLPLIAILTLGWWLFGPLLRRLWAFIASFFPWPTDNLGQRIMCESCPTTIRPGRLPVQYGKCGRCRTASARQKAA